MAGDRPVVMAPDHDTTHVSGSSRQGLAERAGWLRVEWLPLYAPAPNEIERDWRRLKQHYLANPSFQGLADLESRVHGAIDSISRSRCANPGQELYGAA